MSKSNKIYLDHAATTYLKGEVFEEMTPFFLESFGNPSSLHSFGRDSGSALSDAREKIAKIIGAKPSEIYFTSGGTESDNWAIRGVAKKKGKGHIITSSIEHPAVLETCQDLEKNGFEVTYLPVSADGIVSTTDLEQAIREDTILISVMMANNEMGTIQPIKEIGEIAKKHKIIFHTDAVQCAGSMKINVRELGVDMLSMSAHKFYGPKGIGVLFLRSGVPLGKFATGGHQERNMRPGTVAVPLCVGMAKALELAQENMEKTNQRISSLRDKLISGLLEIPHSRLNGSPAKRLPNNVNISFQFIEGESILLLLDMAGIAISTGSACSSGSLKSSYVLMSMGVSEEIAHGSCRFTLGEMTTEEEIKFTIEKTKEIVARLREMSPLFLETKGECLNV